MQTAMDIFYTVKDWEQWKGDWELIMGRPYAMTPSPTTMHQYVGTRLVRYIDEQLDGCEQDCYVMYELDWIISSDTVVRPDIMVVCDQDLGQKVTKAPELIFEIVSNQRARIDEIIKLNLFAQEGVGYYVLVYPDFKKARIYRLQDGVYKKIGDFVAEEFRFDGLKCCISLDFAKIWPNQH
jgi:Uma2 family endonuclease